MPLVILVGDAQVGKTSYLIRLCINIINNLKRVLRCTKNVFFKNTKPTVGVEYATKCVVLKNEEKKIIKVQIWDTCKIFRNFNKK